MELGIHELRIIRRALRYHVGKLTRQAAKSAFVPEPGKVDVTLATLARGRETLIKVETLIAVRR